MPLALVLAPFVSPVSAVEFISNGSFEIGKAIPLNWNGGLGGYVAVDLSSGPSNTDLPGWSGSFTGWYDINNAEFHSAQDGVRFINLIGATGANALSQTFAVTAERVYTVSYYEMYRGVGGIMDTTLSVAAGTVIGASGTPVAVSVGPAASIVQTTVTGNAAWTRHTFAFTPNTTTTATLTFGNRYGGGQGDNDGVFLDNVSVAAPAIPSATNSTVVAIPVTVANDGISTATITVTLRDSSTNLAVGKTVTLASSRIPTTDTISAASGPSGTNGIVTFTVKSTTAGSAVFTATDTTDGIVIVQTATVTFDAGAPHPTNSTVIASPTSVAANGVTTSTITATLLTRSNAPVSGKIVTLASSRGATDTISSPSGPSSASGVVTFTVKSTTTGSAIFTATDTTDVMVVAQTATVTFTPTSVSATNSPVTASPTGVSADGVAASTISVTLKDAYNNPVPGKTVTLASSRPTADTISGASGASTTNGLVTFTVTSVTNGSSVFTATDVTDGNLVLTPTATVAFTNSSAKAILTCSFGVLGAATISGTNISIQVPASQPVTNLAPTFTLSPVAIISPVSGSTNNFANPVTYTVTAQNGSTQRYLVSVTSYALWSNSASLYILTTTNGANLPAGASETNFPVLVRLNNNNFNFSQAKTNGADIRFAAANGAALSYQIEEWSTNSCTASVWVRIPLIKGNTNQEILMYWGKAGAASESSGPAVFNATNGYACVMHMSDPVSPLRDEAGNLSPTDYGTTSTTGMIGRGRHFLLGQGVDCGQTITNFPTGTGPHSTEVWLRPEPGGNGGNRTLVWGQGQPGAVVQIDVASVPPVTCWVDCYYSGGTVMGATVINMSQWVHVAHTYTTNDEARIYINGVLDGINIGGQPAMNIPKPVWMVLGGQGLGAWQYAGGMDEVRVSKVARSANWIKLEYANQKPLQTLMGSLVQSGTNFSVTPASVTINEGAITNIVVQAGGAIKVYWVYKSGTQETVIAVDQPTLNFTAGRVVGDQSFTLSFRAVYMSGVVVTNDIPVTIKEAIDDPVYTLVASANPWDGRQTMTVTPNISNWAAMVADGATNLTCTWSVSGVAVIPQVAPGLSNPGILTTPTLTLLRSQGSGPMTVTLVLDNGGTLVTNTTTIAVQEPATDAWAVRTPGATETPANNEFYARDDTGYGTIYCNGTVGGSTGSVFLQVYTNGPGGAVLYTNLSKAGGGAYAFAARIPAGLVAYSVKWGSVTGTTTNTLGTATNLVCGDAYIINGQSNAVTSDVPDDYTTNYWVRTYNQSANGWSYGVPHGGEGHLGYWEWDIATNIVATYNMPVCMINGAVGGTLIHQQMPNPANHADPATIYGALLTRVQAANLTHGIRGVMWHQGESDSGSGAPTGDWNYKSYLQYFVDMSAAWKQDYPNIRYYYTFQVWPQPCSMNPYGDQIREIQRTMPYMYSNLRVMSTIGVYPPVWCHTGVDGYLMFAQRLGPLVYRDNYGYVPTTPITAPDIKRAWFTTTSRTEIALEFDQNMMWNNAFTNFMFLDGVGGKVTSGTVSGNVIRLQLSGVSTNQTITYVKDQVNLNLPVLGTPVINGSNGIAALTFANFPIATLTPAAVPPALTSLSPVSGRTNGGTVVTLTGSNFLGGATVQFGGISATAVTVNSATQATATTPAHASGLVNVIVSNTNGLSATNLFTYVVPPPPATLGGAGQSGTNLVMVWVGGTNQSCVLLSATNLTQSLSTWTPVATNAAGVNGLSTNTIPVNPGDPQRFYLLSIPYN